MQHFPVLSHTAGILPQPPRLFPGNGIFSISIIIQDPLKINSDSYFYAYNYFSEKTGNYAAFEIFRLIFFLPSRIIILYHKRKGGVRMRIRKKALGDKNLIGARIEAARRTRGMKQKELLAQLQVRGVDLNASALSKLEGQLRIVTDVELLAFAEILDVDVMWLLTGEE